MASRRVASASTSPGTEPSVPRTDSWLRGESPSNHVVGASTRQVGRRIENVMWTPPAAGTRSSVGSHRPEPSEPALQRPRRILDLLGARIRAASRCPPPSPRPRGSRTRPPRTRATAGRFTRRIQPERPAIGQSGEADQRGRLSARRGAERVLQCLSGCLGAREHHGIVVQPDRLDQPPGEDVVQILRALRLDQIVVGVGGDAGLPCEQVAGSSVSVSGRAPIFASQRASSPLSRRSVTRLVPFAHVATGSESACAGRSTPESTSSDSYSSRTRTPASSGTSVAKAIESSSSSRSETAASKHADGPLGELAFRGAVGGDLGCRAVEVGVLGERAVQVVGELASAVLEAVAHITSTSARRRPCRPSPRRPPRSSARPPRASPSSSSAASVSAARASASSSKRPPRIWASSSSVLIPAASAKRRTRRSASSVMLLSIRDRSVPFSRRSMILEEMSVHAVRFTIDGGDARIGRLDGETVTDAGPRRPAGLRADRRGLAAARIGERCRRIRSRRSACSRR